MSSEKCNEIVPTMETICYQAFLDHYAPWELTDYYPWQRNVKFDQFKKAYDSVKAVFEEDNPDEEWDPTDRDYLVEISRIIEESGSVTFL